MHESACNVDPVRADLQSNALVGTATHRHGSLYLLTQGETRGTRRVRVFVDFIASRLAGHATLLAGRKAPGA